MEPPPPPAPTGLRRRTKAAGCCLVEAEAGRKAEESPQYYAYCHCEGSSRRRRHLRRRRLCRRSPVEWRLSRVPPFYYADIIIIMAKGAKEEQKFAAPISSWWPNETMNKIVFFLDNALMSP